MMQYEKNVNESRASLQMEEVVLDSKREICSELQNLWSKNMP